MQEIIQAAIKEAKGEVMAIIELTEGSTRPATGTQQASMGEVMTARIGGLLLR